jgi:hypothetical protein
MWCVVSSFLNIYGRSSPGRPDVKVNRLAYGSSLSTAYIPSPTEQDGGDAAGV